MLNLYRAFQLEHIFSRQDVMDVLKITSSPASVLIKKMKVCGIIEPVKGIGKGRYRFKPYWLRHYAENVRVTRCRKIRGSFCAIHCFIKERVVIKQWKRHRVVCEKYMPTGVHFVPQFSIWLGLRFIFSAGRMWSGFREHWRKEAKYGADEWWSEKMPKWEK